MNHLHGLVLLVIGTALFFSGCAHNVIPASTRAISVYSSYDERVSGTWAVVLDSSLSVQQREIKAATRVCSAHTYPIALGSAVEESVRVTIANVFENTIVRRSAPHGDEMSELGLAGAVIVRMEHFSPRLMCVEGFWSPTCSASAEISLGVSVRGRDGTLMATTASGNRTVDGGGGSSCEGGATVLGDAITASLRQAIEQMAERISNSSRIREARSIPANMPVASERKNELDMGGIYISLRLVVAGREQVGTRCTVNIGTTQIDAVSGGLFQLPSSRTSGMSVECPLNDGDVVQATVQRETGDTFPPIVVITVD